MDWRRINIEDSPDFDRLFPLQAFFNCIGDSSFIKVIDQLTRGIGAGCDSVHCNFPGDLDEYDVAQMGGNVPEGIEFSFDWGEEVYVDIPTFRTFLEMACAAYLRDHPEDRVKIEELLARPQPPLTPPGTNVEPSRLGV